MEKINRSNVNSSQVKAQDFPKSGFDLSYKSRIDFILGRLHPTGYQYIMPADKFSGSNDSKLTFNRLIVPEISDVEVSQHNFYVPFRAIDSSFIKGLVPTELNGMSASWRVPSFTLSGLIQTYLLNMYGSGFNLYNVLTRFWHPVWQDESEYNSDLTHLVNTLHFMLSGSTSNYANFGDVYLVDFTQDCQDWARSISFPTFAEFNTSEGALRLFYNVYNIIFRPLFGEGSLLDYLGYNYLRDIDMWSIAQWNTTYDPSSDPDADVDSWAADIAALLDNCPQSEYAIRAYYAIWYEWYRDDNLEKRSANLPDWRDFGSSSIFSSPGDIHFLATRIRSWQKDMFVGAMPDDICRHVYAPIMNYHNDVEVLSSSVQSNYLSAENNIHAPGPESSGFVNAVSYTISYLDPISGSSQSVVCPLPKAINDSLSTLSSSVNSLDSFFLDLRDLRKSQMLERYLKRNFYFGDEYQDRMLAHYGSKISDNSIRRPHLLSSSVDTVDPSQQVANIGTSQTPVGTRTAIASAQAGKDGFEFFAEEFGIVINIISVMPRAQYAGICPQNLLSQMTDFPLPEFANNNDEFGRVMEVATSGLRKSSVYNLGMFAHFPYAHPWRSRVDEVHGSWLSSKQDWTFRRFFGMDSPDGSPKHNYWFIHCRPNLGMFANTVRLDCQGYMTCDHHFYVERVLPTPVEEI